MDKFWGWIFLVYFLTGGPVGFAATNGLQQPEAMNHKQKDEVNNEKQDQPSIPEDYYNELGVPAINKPWGPYDYLTAVTMLGNLVNHASGNLPHYNDPVAKPYMQHLVDGENIYQILRFTHSHEQRLELIITYLDGIQRLFNIYQQALSQSRPYYAEWVDIIGLSSYLSALSKPEWDYFLQMQDNYNNPIVNMGMDEKIQAINVLQAALVNPIIAGVQAIPQLSAQLSWRLLQHLNYSLPIYASSIPLDVQNQLQQAFLTAYQQSKDREVRLAIKKLISQLYSAS